MSLSSICKVLSLLSLSLLTTAIFIYPEQKAQAQSTHTITINNNCSDTIWVGAVPNVQSVTMNSMSVTTLGGWEMATNTTATVQVPLNWSSGRFWARTGCSFSGGTCPAPGPSNSPPANCCDTGGCNDSSGAWVLNCGNTGQPPATLAEFTFKSGVQDSYDLSLVDGGNVPADIHADSSTYDCSTDSACIHTGVLPNGDNNCTTDTDCYPLFGFGYAWKCDTSIDGGKCVNPFRCGSPGCTDTNGCAAVGLKQSFLPQCAWDSGNSDLAIPKSTCPTDIQFRDQSNQGNTYVGCIAPQKFCRTACASNNQCEAPFTCGGSGFCEDLNNNILGADCDTTTIPCTTNSDCVSPGTCQMGVCTGGAATSNDQLWGCTGTNANSCYTTSLTDPNCCGCPDWTPGFPSGAPNGACIAGNNPEWQTVAGPVGKAFNDACGSAYSFPFDDALKLFHCIAKSGSVTSYTVNFCCPNSDGDSLCNDDDSDADGDGVTNNQETMNQGNTATRFTGADPNDADGDGLENKNDLDSDGDGIPDHTECGGTNDKDRDGESDNFTDEDEDGLNDAHDPDQGGNMLVCIDTDDDGIPDFIDRDSDDDGMTDAQEAGGSDEDGDGILDDSEDKNKDGLADSVDPETGTPLLLEGSGNTGCAIAAGGNRPVSLAFYLLIPALILLRRLTKKANKRIQ